MSILRKKFPITIIFLTLVFISCNDLTPEYFILPVLRPSDNSPRIPLGPKLNFPLAVGNQWIYYDSIWTINDWAIQYDTITIVGTRTDEFGKWWQFNISSSGEQIYYPVISELLDLHDTLFGLVDSGGFSQAMQPHLNHFSINKQEMSNTSFIAPVYIRALSSGVLCYKSYFGDYSDTVTIDVAMYPRLVVTQAGTWDGCVIYSWSGGEETEIIKPGIGIIGYSINSGGGFCGDAAVWSNVTLLSYQIKSDSLSIKSEVVKK